MPKKPKWDELPCPKCMEPRSVNAGWCPHCQSDLASASVAERRNIPVEGQVIGCATIVVLALLVGWCSSKESIPEEPASTAKQDAIALYRKVTEIGAPCDRSAAKFAAAAKSQNLIDMYQAASNVEDSCIEVPSEIRKIEIPESVGQQAQASLESTLETCENAYGERWSGARSLKEVLDRGGKGPQFAEIERSAQVASAGTLMCGGGLVIVATSFGATIDELGAPK